MIDKTELPDNQLLLKTKIDELFNVKVSSKDKIYVIDSEGDLIQINDNISEIKQFFLDKVKIIIDKKPLNLEESKVQNHNTLRSLQNIEFRAITSNLIEESTYPSNLNEVEVFQNLLDLLLEQKKELNNEFMDNLLTKPYSSQFLSVKKIIDDKNNSLRNSLEVNSTLSNTNNELNSELQRMSIQLKSNPSLSNMENNIKDMDNQLKERNNLLQSMKSYYESYNSKLLKEYNNMNERNKFIEKIYQDSSKYNSFLKSEIIRLEKENEEYNNRITQYEKLMKERNETIKSLENNLIIHDLEQTFLPKSSISNYANINESVKNSDYIQNNNYNENTNQLLEKIKFLEDKENNQKLLIEYYHSKFLNDLKDKNYVIGSGRGLSNHMISQDEIDKNKINPLSDFYDNILNMAKEEISHYTKRNESQKNKLNSYLNSFIKDITSNEQIKFVSKEYTENNPSHTDEIDQFYIELVYTTRELVERFKINDDDDSFSKIYTMISLILNTEGYSQKCDPKEKEKLEISNDLWKAMTLSARFIFLIDFMESILHSLEG